MRSIYLIFSLIGLFLALQSCAKFDDINTNPEGTEKVSSGMIATRVIVNIVNTASQKSFMQPYMLNKQIVWTEGVEAYQYNNLGRSAISYTNLNDLGYMVDFAGSEELRKSYQALAHFSRAVTFFETTMRLGDIPYSEAVMGETQRIYFPKYDSQKAVFQGILSELDAANSLFAEGANFDGDPIYGGNTASWQKLVNSYQLSILIQLSKRAADTDLNVAQKFRDIFEQRTLISRASENFELKRSDRSGQLYQFYELGNSFVIFPLVSDELIDRLQARGDRRLFYYAQPSSVQLAAGFAASDFQAYRGVNPAAVFQEISDVLSSRDYSLLNKRYTKLAEGEPTQFLSYTQLSFVLAEAAARGWIAESASEWTQRGIRASMNFVAQYTPDTEEYHSNMRLDNAYINSYLQAYAQGFPTNTEEVVEEIIVQKYLAGFLQTRNAAYYDYRRTGYPRWKIDAQTSLNEHAPEKMPMRWMYPQVEYNQNGAAVAAAVQAQFNGVDDNDQLIWILQ